MARGKQREAWDHTSWLCAVIANHAFGAKQPRSARDFNPLVLSQPRPKLNPKASLALLRGTFNRRTKRSH